MSLLSSGSWVLRVFEVGRIVLVVLGFLMAAWDVEAGLTWLVALVVVPLTGLTALETFVAGAASAVSKARIIGSAYQIQSAMNNLAIALTAVVVLVWHWGETAQVTISLVALIFFALSSMNHAWDYFVLKRPMIHLQRVVLTVLLWVGFIPWILPAFK